jgi:hypothetical protein
MYFNREHKFRGKAVLQKSQDNSLESVNLPFDLQLLPDLDHKVVGQDTTGKMVITLSGCPEDTEEIACIVAAQVQDQIRFTNGRFEIRGGLIAGKRIPETPEEQEKIGDGIYFVRAAIEEVGDIPAFDPKRLSTLRVHPERGPLLRFFNAAKQLEDPVGRYLGLFKVLEKAYADSRGGNLFRALVENNEFFDLAIAVIRPSSPDKNAIDKQDYVALLRDLIRIRDNCAHLRGKTGYAPGDPRIHTEVEPYLPLLEEFAMRCITNEFGTESIDVEKEE